MASVLYYEWLVVCPVCSFSLEIMPRPSTRIQRRAEPMAARPRSTKSQQPMVQDPGLVPHVSATPPDDVPMAPTAPGTTPPGLSNSTIARITSAVTQAVMESLQMHQHNPVLLPLESNTREAPLQGISVADAQGQENLTGEHLFCENCYCHLWKLIFILD